MKEPTYLDALKTSWDLAWHHKSLWIFGLFAAFLGQMGILEILTKVGVTTSNLEIPSALVMVWNFIAELRHSDMSFFSTLPVDRWFLLAWLVVIFVSFGIAFLFVSVISQGALVHRTAVYIAKKGKKMPDAHESWHASVVHFWRLLSLNILRKVLIIAMALFVGWAVANALIEPTLGDNILFLILFVLASIMGLVFSLWLVYAVGYVVIEEYPFVKAIRAAWRLFTNHWLVSFEVGFVIIILDVIASLLALAGVFIVFFPTLFLLVLSIYFKAHILLTIGIVLGIVLSTLYVMLLGSICTVFTTSAWTFLFTKMHTHGMVSRVLSWMGKA